MIFGYLSDHRTEITTWLGYHAWLSALPVVLGLLISLPLGWLACRHRWLYGPLFTIGFQLSYFTPIILGIVLCVLLALAFDTLIVLAARALTPWRRAVKPS